MIEFGPHLLRLVALPAFAWAAWSDYHTRRVDPRLWPILISIGILASIWQMALLEPLRTVDELETLTRIVMVPPVIGMFAAGLYNLGLLGGADVKAIFTISLLFPATLAYPLPVVDLALPLFQNPYRIAAISIIMNGMVLAASYPIFMWGQNIRRGEFSLGMIDTVAKQPAELTHTTGQARVQEDGETYILDLDTLRMYLRWRGIDIETLTDRGEELMDPQTIKTTYEVDDGGISSKWSGDHFMTTKHFDAGESNIVADTNPITDSTDLNDPWAAKQFFESIDHEGYGTTPDDLRHGLSHIVNNETVRVLPAFPMVVPLFGGLLITLTIGDLATAWIVGIF
jgi:preflagellin peptidase FlaK